ncbi:MAG TPA: phenylalanine--tRNA ligase beta subunit-related protein [Candidatus Thermoplasmatota archaeon]|nr:phenylalanine--tRNA ligase beta subunit-related protein [Candidatus Thermoplasmatota archaeon]
MSLVGIAPVVRANFPSLDLRACVLAGLRVTRAPVASEDALADVRAKRTLEGLRDDPLFRAYRDFYWRLGIDPTKQRPSGEALNRRVLQGKELPQINAFVDAYNLASLETGVPIAAFDAGRLEGGVELRFARAGEDFVSIGQDQREVLQGHELVVADAARVIAFYPHRDSDATKVTDATTDVLLVACGAPGVPTEALDDALARAVGRVVGACGGAVVAR